MDSSAAEADSEHTAGKTGIGPQAPPCLEIGVLSLLLHIYIYSIFTFTFRAFSRRFYPKRLTISIFLRRKKNDISLSVQ